MLLDKIKNKVNASFHNEYIQIDENTFTKSKGTLKNSKNITYIIILIFALFTAGQIGYRVLNTWILTNRYNIEYGSEVEEFKTIEEFEIEFEDYDDSDVVDANAALTQALSYLSGDYYAEYSLELDEENELIDNFQITYRLTDSLNREWTIYFNNEDQSIEFEIGNQDNTIANIINVDMIQSLYLNLYKLDTLPGDLYIEATSAGDAKEWYYDNDFVKIDINIEDESTEMLIYPD